MLQMKKTLLTALALGGLVSAHAQSDSTEAAERTLLQPQYMQPVEIRSLRAGSDAPFAKTELYKKDIEKANLVRSLNPFLLKCLPSSIDLTI